MSDVIVVDEQTLVVNSSVTAEIIEVPEQTIVYETTEVPSVVEVPNTTEVLTQDNTSEIIEVGEQILIETAGQQGPPGPPGTGIALVYTAATAISGHTVITLDAEGNALPADPTNLAHANTITGISIGAATAGGQVTAITSGSLAHSGWAFTPGLPVFVGLGGVVTQSPPAAVWQKAIGVARGATVIVVELQPAIF